MTSLTKGCVQRVGLLERDLRGMRKELREAQDTVHDKDRRIAEAKAKVVELEKFKYVLQYKISELQGLEEPRQQRLAALQQQIKVCWLFTRACTHARAHAHAHAHARTHASTHASLYLQRAAPAETSCPNRQE